MEASHEEHIRDHLLELKEKLNETAALSKESSYLSGLRQEVDHTLQKIEKGTFGVCEECNCEIEEDYLEANPMARICFSHLSEEQKESIERDLELANQVQSNLLPPVKTEYQSYKINYHYEPLGPLSGDFYDVIESENSLFFLFGDVSGKGISAALLMSNLNAIFRTLIGADLPLKSLVETANRLFSKSTLPSHFATLVCGKLLPSGDAEISNAGHCLPVVIRKNEVQSMESTGLPVGIYFGANYDVKHFHLEPGDKLFLYTDGLTETRNTAGYEYGEVRLSKLLSEAGSLPTKEMINRVLEDVKTYRADAEKTDDLTIMVIQRNQQ
jgi:sigma-B regulation protein RsbU (phosphoserine phosphatase)